MTTSSAKTEPQLQAAAAPADARQIVSFSFYKVDPSWRLLSRAERTKQGGDLLETINRFSKKLMVLTYSLVGMKADAGFLIWTVGKTLEDVQEMSSAIRNSAIGGHLTTSYSYLSMTKRSTYVDKIDPDHQEKRRYIMPFNRKYLFVYPFVKTNEWYQLPFDQRQAMMDEHIVLGNKYKSVRIHTTYSFGLDDQEFVLAFETDEPKDFLDLVMEMRESKGRPYTLRDTPIFTCVAKPFPAILQDLGG
jgi:chlorite dismutase